MTTRSVRFARSLSPLAATLAIGLSIAGCGTGAQEPAAPQSPAPPNPASPTPTPEATGQTGQSAPPPGDAT